MILESEPLVAAPCAETAGSLMGVGRARGWRQERDLRDNSGKPGGTWSTRISSPQVGGESEDRFRSTARISFAHSIASHLFGLLFAAIEVGFLFSLHFFGRYERTQVAFSLRLLIVPSHVCRCAWTRFFSAPPLSLKKKGSVGWRLED